MNDKEPYRKWVGILLGILLPGSAHCLSGKRAAGLKWYFGLSVCGIVGVALLATPGTVPYLLGAALGLAGMVLSFVMLKQSYRPVRRISFLGWLAVIMLGMVLGNLQGILLRQFVHPFKVPTGTMSPTILPRDHLFVERLSYRFGKPKRGDIVVFRTEGIGDLKPGKFYIKRVAGLPGERIRIEPPFLIVNDQKVIEPKIYSRIAGELDGYSGFQVVHASPFGGFLTRPTQELILGEKEYLVLGDNTKSSLDSRHFGAVPEKNIVGKATRIYWPVNRIGQPLGNE